MSLRVALTHRLGDFTLDAAFEAPAGATVLFGRSGSGKTSIVNAVAGLMKPDRGRIVLDGEVLMDSDAGIWVPAHRRQVGYVFQESRLFPHLSVRGNLAYGRWFARARTGAPDFDQVVALLGIEALLTRRPAGLSGGERQRVAIGRALLAAPRLLLMDEPLAALDAPRKAEILPYLERLRDEMGVPILYVSHAVGEVARLATTLVMLEAGRVARAGPARDVLSDPEAAPGLGPREAGAVLEGRLVAHHADGLSEIALSAGRVFLPRLAVAPGTGVRIRVSARDVMLALNRPEGISALNVLPARVDRLKRGDGGGVLVRLEAGEDYLLARVTARSADALALAPGMPCHAVIKSAAVPAGDIGTIAASPSRS